MAPDGWVPGLYPGVRRFDSSRSHRDVSISGDALGSYPSEWGSIPQRPIPDRLAVGHLTLAQVTVVRVHVWELGSLKTEEDDDVSVRKGARIGRRLR